MRSIIIHLRISADEFQRLYTGTIKDVVSRSRDGLRVRFPANILRSYVTHDGVSGCFQILFDDDNRFQSIEKID